MLSADGGPVEAEREDVGQTSDVATVGFESSGNEAVDEIIRLSLATRLVSLDQASVERLKSGELAELRIVAADAFFSPDDGANLAHTPGIERGVLTYTSGDGTESEFGKFTATYSSGGDPEDYSEGDDGTYGTSLLDSLAYFSIELPAAAPTPTDPAEPPAPAPAQASVAAPAPAPHPAAPAWDRNSNEDPPEDAPLFPVPIAGLDEIQYKKSSLRHLPGREAIITKRRVRRRAFSTARLRGAENGFRKGRVTSRA